MSLKFRYATFLLSVLALLLLFCAVSFYLAGQGRYVLTGMVFLLLYCCTYTLGRKTGKVFLALSLLRLLKKNNGILPRTAYDDFMDTSLGKRRSPEQCREMKQQVLDTLVRENAVSISGDTIVLSP
jgi:hypothetical protein